MSKHSEIPLFPPHPTPTPNPTNLPTYKGQSTATISERPKMRNTEDGKGGVTLGLQSNHWESSGMEVISQDWGG